MLNRAMKYQVQYSPLMSEARNCAWHTLKGNIVEAAKCYEEVFRVAKRDEITPSITRLAIDAAARDIYVSLSKSELEGLSANAQALDKYLTKNINSEKLKEMKEFGEQYTKLYPKTAQMRDTLIESGRVKLPKMDAYGRALATLGDKGFQRYLFERIALKHSPNLWRYIKHDGEIFCE